jgi:hypothetical protein
MQISQLVEDANIVNQSIGLIKDPTIVAFHSSFTQIEGFAKITGFKEIEEVLLA